MWNLDLTNEDAYWWQGTGEDDISAHPGGAYGKKGGKGEWRGKDELGVQISYLKLENWYAVGLYLTQEVASPLPSYSFLWLHVLHLFNPYPTLLSFHL